MCCCRSLLVDDLCLLLIDILRRLSDKDRSRLCLPIAGPPGSSTPPAVSLFDVVVDAESTVLLDVDRARDVDLTFGGADISNPVESDCGRTLVVATAAISLFPSDKNSPNRPVLVAVGIVTFFIECKGREASSLLSDKGRVADDLLGCVVRASFVRLSAPNVTAAFKGPLDGAVVAGVNEC